MMSKPGFLPLSDALTILQRMQCVRFMGANEKGATLADALRPLDGQRFHPRTLLTESEIAAMYAGRRYDDD